MIPVESQPCSYCGLPTTISAAGPDTQVFCCLGCRIASQIVQGSEEGQHRWALTKLGLAIFFSMNVMVFTMVLWTWNVHELPDESHIQAFREVLRYACLLFSAPVLILLGGPLVESSLDAWMQRRFTTDVLLLLGVFSAFAYSTFSLVLGQPDVYFEVACMILVAVTLGKWFEATAKHKASQALRSLQKLLPETVRRVVDGKEHSVLLDEVEPCDLIRVLAGERIPVDGEIESGTASVDEQIITGEALPRVKQSGEPIYGGTLNLDGDLCIRAATSAQQGAIARLVKAVEAAAARDCRSIRVADRVVAWFVPFIVGAAMIAFAVHYSRGTQHALMSSLSVILIACPCALGIATPLALWVAINMAAKHGVLFRDGDVVSRLANVRAIGLDKTGTVTSGSVHVVKELYDNEALTTQIRQIAEKLASSSNHVLSKAIASHLRVTASVPVGAGDEDPIEISDVRDRPGHGITATLCLERWESDGSNGPAVLGSCNFARASGLTIPAELKMSLQRYSENAVVCVGWKGKVQAAYVLNEQLRPESKQVLARLGELDLQLVVLTGDQRQRAAAIERATGVRALGELLPEDKEKELLKLPRPVAMVGDGINDAPALAVADVGIAMDCGADVSRDAADVCLMGSTLENLPGAISLARATQRAIKRNLAWALAYNIVGIGYAITGNLNPIIAAIAMVGSSFFVVTNSFSLANRDFQ